MHKFHDIESLRHVNARVKSWGEYHNLESLPTIKFRGTVKLHGTNGGVRVTNGNVLTHGRGRVLGLGKGEDECGFAFFTSSRQDEFRQLTSMYAPGEPDVTVYGEWCGIGIQKGCAVHKLPKMFVVFDVKVHDGSDEGVNVDIHDNTRWDADLIQWLNQNNIFLITQFPTYEVDINFNDPQPAAEEIERLTLEVEESCPVANSSMFSAFNHGENIGIGEGIVWLSTGHHERLTFKSKGLKHKKAGTKVRVELAPEVVESINAFVELVLPEWRLQQGLDEMNKMSLPIVPENTGHYIAWVSKDVLKEHSDTLEANGLDWKQVSGPITVAARKFFFDAVGTL